jgi:hypothetical protein
MPCEVVLLRVDFFKISEKSRRQKCVEEEKE